jgi:uncharacterized protein
MSSDADVAAGLLREVRSRAGLSQRELARRAGVTQSVISAYESGHRQPSLPTVAKLIRAAGHELRITAEPASVREPLSGSLGERVRSNRAAMTEIAARHGVTNLRVFGSVARGTEGPDSDVDVLVDLPADAGLFTLMRLQAELSGLLGAPVEVIPADSLRAEVRADVERDMVGL